MKTDVDRIRTTPQQRKPAPKTKSKSLLAVLVTVCLALALYGAARLFFFSGKEEHLAEAGQAKVERAAPSRVSPDADDASARGATRSTIAPAASSASPSPSLPVSAATSATTRQTIDLLALVDVQRDRLRAEGNAGVNQWTKSGGQLAFSSVDKRAGKIAAPVALNGLRDYEVEIGVTTASEAPFILDLPMSATNQATVAFVPGQVVLMRDGNSSKEFGTWPKDAGNPPWKLAARVKFDADGTNGTISATINTLSVSGAVRWVSWARPPRHTPTSPASSSPRSMSAVATAHIPPGLCACLKVKRKCCVAVLLPSPPLQVSQSPRLQLPPPRPRTRRS